MVVNNRDFAIVIGINGYSQLRALGAAVSDATAFAEWLVDPDGGGLPEQNVAIILSPTKLPPDPFDARPIQRDIDRALRDFGVEQSTKIGRRLYFYFSGHGFGPTFDDVGMLMADAAMKRLKSNVGLRPYRVFFHDNALFDELVFILDCCRDPFLSEETMGPPFTLTPTLPLPTVEDFSVLAAAYGAKAFERSANNAEERRGILTKALLEALRDRAAVDPQGQITAFTLREYLLRRVGELATDEKLKSGPEIPALPNRPMVFGNVPAGLEPTLRVRITPPAGFTGILVLRHGSNLQELDRHAFTAAGEVWDVDLPRNSLYAVDSAGNSVSAVIDPRNVKDDPYVFRLQ